MRNVLDTNANPGNTKVAKTQKLGFPGAKNILAGEVRVASLSLMPDSILCPGSKAAGCFDDCLKLAGRGVFENVKAGRQWRADLWHADREQFLARLRAELSRFEKLCEKRGVQPVARLNVLSDIDWETYGIPQQFPNIFFYDYTKRAARLGKTPENYRLMFSYSARHQYRKQVLKALAHDVPIAVVFSNYLPESFLGREVIDGDNSDLVNAMAGNVIIGLRAKGPAKKSTSGFVVNPDVIPTFEAA